MDGHWNTDGSFSYDLEKISQETGWSVEDIKLRGVAWCRRNAKAESTCSGGRAHVWHELDGGESHCFKCGSHAGG